jgi:hypothetical protein
VGEDAAFEVLDKHFAHIGLGAVVVALVGKLACAGQRKPSLIVLGHGLVPQRALRVALVVELGLAVGGHGQNKQFLKITKKIFLLKLNLLIINK